MVERPVQRVIPLAPVIDKERREGGRPAQWRGRFNREKK